MEQNPAGTWPDFLCAVHGFSIDPDLDFTLYTDTLEAVPTLSLQVGPSTKIEHVSPLRIFVFPIDLGECGGRCALYSGQLENSKAAGGENAGGEFKHDKGATRGYGWKAD